MTMMSDSTALLNQTTISRDGRNISMMDTVTASASSIELFP